VPFCRASSAAAAAGGGVELFAIAVMYEINFNPVAFHVRTAIYSFVTHSTRSQRKKRKSAA